MSFLPPDTIKVIAEFSGVTNLSDDVAIALAQEIEYKSRDVVQEAMKFMRHSKRTKLRTEDINRALRVRNVEKLYGFDTSIPVKFKHLNTSSIGSIFYLEDKELDLDEIINDSLPKIPPEMTVTGHWLMIEGVQPAIPQNPAPIEIRIENLSKKLKTEGKFDFLDRRTEIKPLVRHVLSKEIQIYYEKIIEALQSDSKDLINAALESIREDNGIQQLLPYFIQFITEKIALNLRNLEFLWVLVRVVDCILVNPHFFVEPYLHQLMPPVISCIVSRRLSESPYENHWELRKYSSQIMAKICAKYGHSYQTLQPRVTKTLLRAFLDPLKPLTTKAGAIMGLSSLGPYVVKILILPNLQTFMNLLEPILAQSDESVQNSSENEKVKYLEASKCKDCLKNAVVKYMRSELPEKAQVEGEMSVDGENLDFDSIEYISDIINWFGEQIKTEV